MICLTIPSLYGRLIADKPRGENHMKRNLKSAAAILISLVLVLMLAACGNTTEQDKAFVCGTVDGMVYESSFAGLRLTVPEGWEYSSEEEILEMMDIASDIAFEDDKARQVEIAKQRTIYDCMAADPTVGTNIIIMYENMSAAIGGSLYTPESYAEVLEKQLKETELGYEITGKETTTLCDKEYYCMTAKASTNGVAVEQCYLLRKVGDYMLCICMTILPDSGTTYENVTELFEALPEQTA